MAFGDIGDDVVITQTLSGETAYIDITYASTTAKTYYSNNGITDLSGVYDYIIDGILDATVKNDTSGAIITGLIPGSTWVVHVESAGDLSGGKKQINIKGPPAKPVPGSNFTIREFTNKIHFDFETDSSIWNHGVPYSAKVIIKSLNNANTFKSVTKPLSNTDRSFDITDLSHNTPYELKVQLENKEHGVGPMSDSIVFSTDDNRAAVNILSATGLQSLVSSSAESYVDICFNVGTSLNKARTGDIVRFALDDSTTLMSESSVINVKAGDSYVRLQSKLLTGGAHTIKLLVRRENSDNVNSTSDGNASNSASFTTRFKPDAPSVTVNPINDLDNKIVFTFDAGANNGWPLSNDNTCVGSVCYKAVITAEDNTVEGASTASNELIVNPGEVTLTKDQLTELSGVTLNSKVRINVVKRIANGDVNDGAISNLELDATAHPHFLLFYIVDPDISSVTMTESDAPNQNYLHIEYVLGTDAVHATESKLTAYIRHDKEWDVNDPKTASAEFSSAFTLGPELVGADVAINSGVSDGSNVYLLLELNNKGKTDYKIANVTLKDREPEPALVNLFGWSDHGTDNDTAAFDFEFDKPTNGILANQRFEVWLKDLSSGVFKNVASDLDADKLRAGGVTIRALIAKTDIVDASGLSFSEEGYSAPSQLSFGVAQTNTNYPLTSSDFTDGFTNDQGKVTQAVASVKYHPVNIEITSVAVNSSNGLSVEVTGTNLSGLNYLITVFNSSSNQYITLLDSAAGTFSENDGEALTVTTMSPILTKPEYRLVLQVKDGADVRSKDTLVFTHELAPVIDTSVPLIQVIGTKNVDNALNSGTTIDVSGRYAVSIDPNGSVLTDVEAMYYSDNLDTSFVKVEVPVLKPDEPTTENYTAYLEFTNREGAILIAANAKGMDAHHFYAPQ